jgi:hypothetical protein
MSDEVDSQFCLTTHATIHDKFCEVYNIIMLVDYKPAQFSAIHEVFICEVSCRGYVHIRRVDDNLSRYMYVRFKIPGNW